MICLVICQGNKSLAKDGLPVPAVSEDRSDVIPKRRENQSRTSTGHILTPAAANIPGIGFFYGFIGGIFNTLNTETDIFSYRFWGEMSGGGLGLTDISLHASGLSLNIFYNVFDRASIELYPRGIKSDADQKKIKHLNFFDAALAQINWRFFDRRIQLNAGINRQRETISHYSDLHYDHIFPDSDESLENVNLSYGSIFDLTDDRYDPRKGMIFEIFRYDRPRPVESKAWYYTLDYNLSVYVPVLRYSTLVFNSYRSDALVRRKGSESEDSIRNSLPYQCSGIEDQTKKNRCEELTTLYVRDQKKENGHGSAIPIGGTQRMQAYPTNRLSGAHTQTFGTEFRLNLTQEFSPFNIGILSGIRTGLQLAAFYEVGTATDHLTQLYQQDQYINSYGGGIRLLLASGFVIRLDFAKGNEGTQSILIFQYPWNVF